MKPERMKRISPGEKMMFCSETSCWRWEKRMGEDVKGERGIPWLWAKRA